MITQLTQLVEHALGIMDFLRALLVLMPIRWMYGGYVWLTNAAIAALAIAVLLIEQRLESRNDRDRGLSSHPG